MKTLVKFCGMMRTEDILVAGEAGVDYLGFVLVPGSRRFLQRNALPELLAAVPCNVKKVFVVADMELSEIAQLIAEFHPDAIQLHGNETADFARAIQAAEVWKAVHLQDERELEKFTAFPAEFLVADAGQGGSGQCCDWQLAAKLAKHRKIFLAGGIHPENTAAALATTHAVGLDIASGIEDAPGKKNRRKMQQLMTAIQQYEQVTQ
ncbi:MAG: phosphoribosylanthranilate isomerase [Lentisphaeria bacterium]